MLVEPVAVRIRRGRLWVLAVAVVPVALLASAAPALADNVWNVDCSVPDLISAVNQADAAGGGTINLASGCTYTFTAADNDYKSGNALPVLTGLTNGLTLNGNGATLQRSSADGTPQFRLIDVGIEQVIPAGTGGNECSVPTLNPEQENVTIEKLTIRGGDIQGAGGGGILDHATRLQLVGDTVSANTSSSRGGGLAAVDTNDECYAVHGRLSISDSAISDNTDTDSAFDVDAGGGIFTGQNATVTGSTLVGNHASDGGGAYIASDTTLTNDTIIGNSAMYSGGGLDVEGNVSLVADTIGLNAASGSATAIRNDEAIVSSRGSIIDGSSATVGGTFDKGHNVFVAHSGDVFTPDSSCGGSIASCGSLYDVVSADLGPLGDNGGPTETEAIGSDSPAYHFVPAADCAASDQRGVARPQPAGAVSCNAGAYETQAVATTLTYTGPSSADYGSPVTLSATLTQPNMAIALPRLAGGGVGGQMVTIGFGAESCTANTDSSGKASCQVTATDTPPGSPYQIAASYAGAPDGAGADYYQAASDSSRSLTVSKAPTALTATPAIPSGISATLTDSDTGEPLSGQTLVFTAGGSQLCTATTNTNGTASCKTLGALLGALLHLGYTATYSGSADYKPSSAHGSAIGLGLQLTGLARTATSAGADRAALTPALEHQLRRLGRARLEHRLEALRRSARGLAGGATASRALVVRQ